jgi:D-beta-D-heptose 7-phosphate kinase / D-beta-D-heptose 1-phosphate adenosyltransferase
MKPSISSITDDFAQLRVLVIGEAILESYIRGNAQRLSLEAPAPVVGVQTGKDNPGGAASAALNARSLGAEVTFLSVIGKDSEGEALLQLLRARGIFVDRVLRRPDRSTLLRRRIYADTRLLVRYDQGSREPISSQTEDLLFDQLRQLCSQMDVVILSDYGGSILTPRLIELITQLQSEQSCVLVADTRRLSDFRHLKLAAIRPGSNSALDLLDTADDGHKLESEERLIAAGQKILEMLNTQLVAITLDDDGALVFERGKGKNSGVYRTYAQGMPFNRVDGAGDAFISGLALALAVGAQAPAAAEIASAVATLVVQNGGQATCCIEEVKAYLDGDEKLLDSREAVAERMAFLHQQNKRIVFTNGCFDILHSAHVGYLNQAKSFGDILVIGVNTDESVQRLKGPERPINSLEERLKVLSGLSCVDYVIPFDEDTPASLIESVQPDIFVKGGDYTRETLPEAEVVERFGGKLRIIPYVENHSTSGVIERIRQLYAPPLNLEKVLTKLPEVKAVTDKPLDNVKVTGEKLAGPGRPPARQKSVPDN